MEGTLVGLATGDFDGSFVDGESVGIDVGGSVHASTRIQSSIPS